MGHVRPIYVDKCSADALPNLVQLGEWCCLCCNHDVDHCSAADMMYAVHVDLCFIVPSGVDCILTMISMKICVVLNGVK